MGRLAVAIALLAALVPGPGSAKTAVLVTVDKSHQRMTVSVDGIPRYSWDISTGRAGYGTPSGIYRPQHLARKWFSKEYYDSPMPYSVFFHGGFAIHGSYEIARLGGPASHGCIRLHPANAAILFRLIKTHGTGNTRIIVRGSVRTNAKRHPRTKHRRVGRRRNPEA
jgi:lipoprotein-anchoring transpeptidase ErfK/SrfK